MTTITAPQRRPAPLLSPHQVQVMLHALGVQRHAVKRRNWGYRNGFVAAIGTSDDAAWADLVQQGCAALGRANENQHCYYVTELGVDVLGTYGHEVTPKMREACQPGGGR